MTLGGRSKRVRRAKGPTNISAATNLPDVYTNMLADAASSPSQVSEEGKTIKRRRIAGRVAAQDQHNGEEDKLDQPPSGRDHDGLDPESGSDRQQTVYNDSEESAESDMDWEEVDFSRVSEREDLPEGDDAQNSELKLVLGTKDQEAPRSMPAKRKPISSAERQLRLHIHKLHLLSLLFHVHLRNHWCNDKEVHGALKGLLSNRTMSYLNPNKEHSQFQRSRSFNDGLKQACTTFSLRFKITARGISRPHWTENLENLAANVPKDLELPMQKYDFYTTAAKLEASRDTGAQLFCALLRSAGVDARLVCSLQPLPFTVTNKGIASRKTVPSMVVAASESQTDSNDEKSDLNTVKAETDVSKPIGTTGGRSRFSSDFSPRGGLSNQNHPIRISEPLPKRIKESAYPVFWVEGFDEAYQKWISVNPFHTASGSSKFEPPASDARNNLTYVIAFEHDGSARDVTRRYAKAFNAKTRKGRVEVTQGGEKWWRKILQIYRRLYNPPRDEIEDSELASKELAEPMPRNVLDFKDHPYYALERHLKRSEVIYPKREAGKVAVGRTGGNQILEPIFRRRDVHQVKSARSWHTMGREIKTGEQPLKRVPAHRKRESTPENDDDADSTNGEHMGTPLYAAHQTTLYIPPPVTNGRIPKNSYGNLDIYVPSMVPAGGTHITHRETARAAQILGIDHAKAVTGFVFKGRHGTAVIDGAVVASEYRDAVQEVIDAFGDEKAQEEEMSRSLEALRMWKRLLAGLRIRERIAGYEIEGERALLDERMGELDDEIRDEEEEGGGGFFPDRMVASSVEPTFGMFQQSNGGNGQDSDGGGGFLGEETVEDEEQSFVQANRNALQPFGKTQILEDHDQPAGGGFLTDDVSDGGDRPLDHNQSIISRYIRRSEGNHGGFLASNMDEDAEEETVLLSAGNSERAPPASLSTRIAPGPEETPRPGQKLTESTGLVPDESSDEVIPHAAVPPESTAPAPTSFTYLNLPESELAEATMLQLLHEAREAASPAPAECATIAPIEPCHQQPAASPNIQVLPPPADEQPSSPQQPGVEEDEGRGSSNDEEDAGSLLSHDPSDEGRGSSNDEEDAGSLLSHDPSDEDADPDWLA